VSLFDLGPAPAYAPPRDHRDEMVDRSGVVRPAWHQVQATLLAAGPDALGRDAARIQRRLHSHGAAFEMNSGAHRGWRLDPVPIVVERAEWAGLGRALAQRARVLEAVLADVFGGQRLLSSGLLPVDAVMSHRDHLRPCVGVPPGGGRHLVLHAADVARGPDGSFSVIADRTQAPSGAGYTLENREVLSATYPELVRSSGVEPLRPWFSALRLTLAQVAPPGVDDPRIVILTPGPLAETYFEHGFLSRALGYTLVEPGDLTVRDGRVWLKSVTGLEPVHVILRRQDAEWCDSLELRPDSLLGVPGLVEAARRRNVSIVNPLGSGLAESPALLPYLDRLTRALLDEDPLISSAPTWWCGDPSGRSHVLANLDRLVLKPISRGHGRQSIYGRLLSRSERDELSAQVEARPHLWVGQEEQHLSTAPALDGAAIVPRYAVLRAFLVAQSDGFTWMEGGLTRTADDPGRVTMATGGTSKDTWVVAPPAEHSWVARRAVALPQVDLRDSVTAGSAASMFWIGRNLERAETAIRLVRSVDETIGLWPELRDEAEGAWVSAACAALGAFMDDGASVAVTPVDEASRWGGLEAVSVRVLGDATMPRSLTTSLRYLVRGGRSVRERLSTDAWRMLSELELRQPGLDDAAAVQARELAESMLAPLSALSGLVMESMVRDPAWRFLDLGRRIERSELLCTIVGAALVPPVPETVAAPLHEAVLAGWDCLGAYRRRHRSDVERPAMLALLLDDGGNPRSLRFQVDRMGEDVDDLPAPATGGGLVHHVDALRRIVAAVEPNELSRPGADGRLGALAELLSSTSGALARLADAAELEYFAQVGPGTVVGDESWGRR
jgi:uncharacterized circularly permuted ATP-grasp superfamily protein/uncharacterized alpha-E superfamily protein